jgi:hypothetical protein
LFTTKAFASPASRNVYIDGQSFYLTATNEPIVMSGPNVVVKGPPYMPSVSGDTYCNDIVNDECSIDGSCESCFTFNEYDIANIKSMGWNTIRLGVVWAGAQPNDEDALDPDFVSKLQAVLKLCGDNDINVILDNHGDMVGSAGCGNGVPMWFQQKASPDLIGKQLVTGLPYSVIPGLNINEVEGYDYCGDNETSWAQYAGDPNYNLLNECCLAMNSPNPGGLGYTTISQATMDYLVEEGQGRDDFVRFWTLMAEAVVDYPAAIACELMNEPMTIRRTKMYETWQACAIAINNIIPDMSVSLCDVGEGALYPDWVTEHFSAGIAIHQDTIDWIKNSTTLFYAWHWYGAPSDPNDAIQNVQAIMDDWNIPSFATEFMSCDIWNDATNANISHSYWHYSSYCNTGPDFGNLSVPDETFGGCILGWAGGNSQYSCEEY